jgi:hypothetical protein
MPWNHTDPAKERVKFALDWERRWGAGSRTTRSLYSAVTTRRFVPAGGASLRIPDRTAARTAATVPSRDEEAPFLLDVFCIVTEFLLVRDGNWTRGAVSVTLAQRAGMTIVRSQDDGSDCRTMGRLASSIEYGSRWAAATMRTCPLSRRNDRCPRDGCCGALPDLRASSQASHERRRRHAAVEEPPAVAWPTIWLIRRLAWCGIIGGFEGSPPQPAGMRGTGAPTAATVRRVAASRRAGEPGLAERLAVTAHRGAPGAAGGGRARAGRRRAASRG